MSLAQQTLSGFIWTLTSRMGTRFSIFVVGIILARILTPEDFGLVAMLGVFFAVSSSLVDSGFTQALIREKEISEKDKSTTFYINIITSIVLYVILWFSSPLIARFFKQPELLWLTRVMGLDIIFRAFSIVQRAVLMQSLRFKLLSAIDITASILTGIIAILLAYKGWGVWALVIKYFLFSLFVSITFWVLNPWLPKGFIDKVSFRKLFGFGSKLMLTGLLNTFYSNIYNLVIGKFFAPALLGFYNRAFTFTSQTVSSALIALQQVTYPILSKTRENPLRLKEAYRKIIMSITFINFPLATFIIFGAEPLILLLLGEKWEGTIPFLQLLSVSVLVNHISSINQNLLKVIGRSDLYLKFSLLNKALLTIAILVGLQFGIWGLVIGGVIVQYLEVFIMMFLTSRLINYSALEQLKDILPTAILLIPLILIFIFVFYLNIHSHLFKLLIMFVLGSGGYLFAAIITKSAAYAQIKELLLPYIIKRKNN